MLEQGQQLGVSLVESRAIGAEGRRHIPGVGHFFSGMGMGRGAVRQCALRQPGPGLELGVVGGPGEGDNVSDISDPGDELNGALEARYHQ